jgi:hypothetical protein
VNNAATICPTIIAPTREANLIRRRADSNGQPQCRHEEDHERSRKAKDVPEPTEEKIRSLRSSNVAPRDLDATDLSGVDVGVRN